MITIFKIFENSTNKKEKLKIQLAECTEGERLVFKRMYSPNNLELPINDIVYQMKNNKLDWAIKQVEQTIKNKFNKEVKKYNL